MKVLIIQSTERLAACLALCLTITVAVQAATTVATPALQVTLAGAQVVRVEDRLTGEGSGGGEGLPEGVQRPDGAPRPGHGLHHHELARRLRGCRCAQPPANVYHPSGVHRATPAGCQTVAGGRGGRQRADTPGTRAQARCTPAGCQIVAGGRGGRQRADTPGSARRCGGVAQTLWSGLAELELADPPGEGSGRASPAGKAGL